MKSNKQKLSSILTGVSGEYFVAAELSRRGFLCSVTLKNTKGIDILVANEEATKNIGIQVKSNQGAKATWILNEKAENFYSENLYYVFVNLKGIDTLPDFYIVPSKVVSSYINENHKNWLATPGKKGQAHNDSSIRSFKDETKKYLNRWDLLNL